MKHLFRTLLALTVIFALTACDAGKPTEAPSAEDLTLDLSSYETNAPSEDSSALPTVEATAEPTEATAEPTEATAEPTEATAEPTEATAEPTEATAEPTEVTAEPTEAPTVGTPTVPGTSVPIELGTTEALYADMTFTSTEAVTVQKEDVKADALYESLKDCTVDEFEAAIAKEDSDNGNTVYTDGYYLQKNLDYATVSTECINECVMSNHLVTKSLLCSRNVGLVA